MPAPIASDRFLVLKLFAPEFDPLTSQDAPAARTAAVGMEALPILSPSMTLGEFFTAYYLPVALRNKHRSPRTIDELSTTLALWRELTGDPVVGLIDDVTVAAFVEQLGQPLSRRRGKLLQKLQLAPATVRKHCAQIAPILRALGPRRPWNKRGSGLIAEPPEIEPPPAGDVAPIDAPDLAALEALYQACASATVPQLSWIDAPTWWRGLIVTCYESALRIGSLIYCEWSWLRSNNPLRGGDTLRGTGQTLTLHVPGARYKGGRGRVFPLNAVAGKWFDLLAESQRRGGVFAPSGRVFRWPHDPDPAGHAGEHNSDLGYLHATRRKLFAACDPPIRGGFHALRRAHATLRPLVDLAASQAALGHADARTTSQHYVGAQVAAAVVDGLPQPHSFVLPK